MPRFRYLTAPVPSDRLPSGIPYIVGNEAAERFSFYGMRAILVVFMTQYLLAPGGQLDTMSEVAAITWYHRFVSAVYFFPIAGALLADVLWGKYRTILLLSMVYCLGHLSLALDETRLGLTVGLVLIAIGAGGIKPCVSAHVGDQFGASNQSMLEKVFGWFYFSINLGSFGSTLLTPVLLDRYGPSVAFGVPGGLMFLATVVFWLGRYRFVHIPAGGLGFIEESLSGRGLGAVARLVPIYFFVAVFWSLYDQTGSAWVLQARNMDRHFLGFEWLQSQVQAANPVMIMAFIPLFSYVVYPGINKVFSLTPLRKIGLGFFVTAGSFAVSAVIEHWIAAEQQPSIVWQLLAYAVLTAGEVMVSITCLEFSYTQAPKKMKSLIMGLYLLSVSLGNQITALVNQLIEKPGGGSRLPGSSYYWFFTGLMLFAAVGFVLVAMKYRGQACLQDEALPGEVLSSPGAIADSGRATEQYGTDAD